MDMACCWGRSAIRKLNRARDGAVQKAQAMGDAFTGRRAAAPIQTNNVNNVNPMPTPDGGTSPAAAAHLQEPVSPRRHGGVEMFVTMLRTSALLAMLPDVRRQALLQSIAASGSREAAQDVMMENMVESPYVPPDVKNNLAELVLTHQWDALRVALRCVPSAGATAPVTFADFKKMVITVFTKSRKIAQLPPERRSMVGHGIQLAASVDELKEFAVRTLESAQNFDRASRQLIANDILDNRFDRLLLPDRFDCDEVPRRRSQPIPSLSPAPPTAVHHDSPRPSAPPARPSTEGGTPAEGSVDIPSPSAAATAAVGMEEDDEDECPVCLGTNVIDVRLVVCSHRFCGDCLRPWVAQHGNCPMCRQEVATDDIAELA